MKGTWLCGAITVRVPQAPDYMNACNCDFCTKLGALWGYYPSAAVEVTGEPASFVRTDLERPKLRAHFCGRCGATTHYSSIDPEVDRRAVNMRLFDPERLAGVEVRYGDRRHHAGTDPRRYWRAPTRFGEAGVVA